MQVSVDKCRPKLIFDGEGALCECVYIACVKSSFDHITFSSPTLSNSIDTLREDTARTHVRTVQHFYVSPFHIFLISPLVQYSNVIII